MRRIQPPPRSTVASPDRALQVPSFSDWMEKCLYETSSGYYASGKVEFGHGRHFWTYPKRLSPLFGWMLFDAAFHLLEDLAPADDDELTILEFGAGDGDLARDVMDRARDLSDTAEFGDFARRVRYRIVEPSHALRARQTTRLREYIDAGLAEVLAGDIRTYRQETTFTGLVFGNEVFDALPVEQLVVQNDGVYRTHVTDDANEVLVGIDDGWIMDGRVSEAPEDLRAYLKASSTVFEDLHRHGLLPIELYWAPAMQDVVRTIAELLSPRSMALFVDYGGTTRHVADPRSLAPHFRTYGPLEEERDFGVNPYEAPGNRDLTWDVDFTEIARLAGTLGVHAAHFGHQSMLESVDVDLWDEPARSVLLQGRAAEGYVDDDVELEAERLVFSFREAPGFRTIVLNATGGEISAERFGPTDDLSPQVTLADHSTPTLLHDALAPLELEELAGAMGPCSDVVANLSDTHWYEARHEVLDALKNAGLLTRGRPHE